MSILYLLYSHSKRLIALAVAASLVSAGGTVVALALVGRALQPDVHPDRGDLLLFAGAVLALSAAGLLARRALSLLGTKIVYELRLMMAKRILNTELSHQERLGSHSLQALLTSDVDAISSAFELLPTVLLNGAITLGSVIYLLTLSVRYFVIFAVLALFAILVARVLMKKMQRLLAEYREQQNSLYKAFEGLVYGMKELTLSSQKKSRFYGEILGRTALRMRRVEASAELCWTVTNEWGLFSVFLILGALIVGRDTQLLAPEPAAGNCALIIIYLLGPIGALMSALPVIGRGTVALRKCEAAGLAADTDFPAARVEPTANAFRDVKFSGVEYAYTPDSTGARFHVGPLDLQVRAGEITVITGFNGTGKSTLVKLLSGQYRASRGDIYLNGDLITDTNLQSYREHFSVVYSDAYIFDRLLKYADTDGAIEGINHHLRELGLDGVVRVEQGRFSTTQLSQGQRKRLALLVACLDDRPIFLFDEWAAEQDRTFRDYFYTGLLPALRARGKCVIATSHDERFFSCADHVLILDSGKLSAA